MIENLMNKNIQKLSIPAHQNDHSRIYAAEPNDYFSFQNPASTTMASETHSMLISFSTNPPICNPNLTFTNYYRNPSQTLWLCGDDLSVIYLRPYFPRQRHLFAKIEVLHIRANCLFRRNTETPDKRTEHKKPSHNLVIEPFC